MNELGVWGETLACEHLKKSGYEIVARNFSMRCGEIDIIAQNGRYIVFAEVRQRRSGAAVSAIDSISPQKMKKIYRTALLYLSGHPTHLQPRFDVIAITGDRTHPEDARIQWIENAFDGDYF